MEVTISSVKSADVTYKIHSGYLAVHLPWRVYLASVLSGVGRWVSGSVSALHSRVPGLISSREDHCIYHWWDLIRPKKLPSVSICHAQVFAGFSGHDNSILLTKYFRFLTKFSQRIIPCTHGEVSIIFGLIWTNLLEIVEYLPRNISD